MIHFITTDNYELGFVEQFIYLGSTKSNNVSLTRDVERPIGIDLDQDQGNSVVSTLCLGNEFQITYAAQEKTLPYALTKEATWDTLNDENTKHSCSV